MQSAFFPPQKSLYKHNPNGLILGTPGSGKSFSAKREIVNVFLITKDDIVVCDPEGEYFPLVERLRGQVIRISPTSTDYINPMDINANYSEEEVYCKGRLSYATKKPRGDRLICSDMKRFRGKEGYFRRRPKSELGRKHSNQKTGAAFTRKSIPPPHATATRR